MLAKVLSFGICGISAYPVTIEVDVASGLPGVVIVGLPDNAIKESKERIRTAIKNSGFEFPCDRITINLAPADTKKEGPGYDLAMALGVLAASQQIPLERLGDFALTGELSLDGQIHPSGGVLCIAMAAAKERCPHLIVPQANAAEAAFIKDIAVFPVRTLQEAARVLTNPKEFTPVQPTALTASALHYDMDFSDVKGQAHVKRGLEIAAAGGHNVLMIGPPGSGKTMMAKRLATILPDMSRPEMLETTQIHSVMGLVPANSGLVDRRPFRCPHHTSSDIALVGGGSMPRPGEVTLAHNGVLFLDELPEFNRNVLESLRQPLEDHYVTISRVSKSLRFPSKFMLVAAMNPCPCGFYTDSRRACQCTPPQIQRYMSKISGPLLDRIDLHLEVPALSSDDLLRVTTTPEPSAAIKTRTVQARNKQLKRFEGTSIFANAHMNSKCLKQFCALSEETKTLLRRALEELHLSARAHDKIIKIARTIADLDNQESITTAHIAEAIQYRSLDRKW